MPAPRANTPARLRWAAIAILVVGLLAAAGVHLSATRAPGPDSIPDSSFASPDDSTRREMQQVERLGGKATVMTVEFNRWLGSLWHGERLAWTLAVLSIAAALGCRSVASLMEEPGDDAPP